MPTCSILMGTLYSHHQSTIMALTSWLVGKSKRMSPEENDFHVEDSPSKKFKKCLYQNAFDWYVSDESGKWHCSVCRSAKIENAYARGHDTPAKTTNHRRHAASDTHLNAVMKSTKSTQAPIKKIFADKIEKDDFDILTYLKCAFYIAQRELAKEEFPNLIQLVGSLGVGTISTGNVTYTSDKSVTEFQQAIASVVLEDRLAEIKQSDLFSIMIDESTDKANAKTLLIYVQYLFEGKVKTCLLENVEVLGDSFGAAQIVCELLAKFKVYGLDVCRLVGIASDGASVMTGNKSGVVVRLKTLNQPLVGVHCAAHRISLASSHAVRDIPDMVRFNKTISSVFSYFNSSALRNNKLREIQSILNTPLLKYTPIHAVRWLSLHRAVDVIYRTYPALVVALETDASDDNVSAKCILDEITQYKFVAIMHLLMDILPFLSKLSKLFQYETVDFSKIMPAVISTCDALRDLKQSDGSFVDKLDFYIKEGVYRQPVDEGKKSKIVEDTNLNIDGFEGFTSTSSQCVSASDSHPINLKYCAQQQQRFKSISHDYIDNVVDNLQSRFQDTGILENMNILLPKKIKAAHSNDKDNFVKYGTPQIHILKDHYKQYICCDEILSEYTQYKRLVVGSYCENSLHEITAIINDKYLELLPNIYTLLKIACLLPISSASCERGFSTQNRIKSKLRTNMSNKTLNDLMRISEDAGPSETFPFKRALLKWKSMKQRKIYQM